MSSLKTLLQAINRGALDAGGSLSTKALQELRAHRQKQLVVFACIEAVVIAAVAFSAYYITHNPGATSGTVKLLCGALGIGAGGGIEVMRRIWKDWSRTDLLLALLTDASEAQVQNIIDKLIKAL